MNFSYPPPRKAWKQQRSLLLDHFPHEYDFMRWLVGDGGVTSIRQNDGFDIYAAAGILQTPGGAVRFFCRGDRRDTGATTFPEWVALRFEDGGKVDVDTMTGVLTVSGRPDLHVGATDYDLRFADLMRNFAAAIRGEEEPYLSAATILDTATASVALATDGWYQR